MWQKIKNLYHLGQAILFAFLYRFPARHLTVIGVTGTDGKTTTVLLKYKPGELFILLQSDQIVS